MDISVRDFNVMERKFHIHFAEEPTASQTVSELAEDWELILVNYGLGIHLRSVT